MNPSIELAPAPDPAAVVAKAVLASAEHLGLTHRELAEVIGVSVATVLRWQGGRGIEPASKDGERALLLIRLFCSLDGLVGGHQQQARAWMCAMNDHVGGVPAERITSNQGLIDVVEYVEARRGYR